MRKLLLSGLLLAAWAGAVYAEELPKEVLGRLNAYNVVYDHPAVNGSGDSMPLGNGDITVNAWVEEDGDLLLYIGKQDSWSEAGRLLKVGCVRVHLAPNPFTRETRFRQTLNLADGCIDLSAGDVTMKLWVDANAPVIRLDVRSSGKRMLSVSNNGMRPEKVYMNRRDFELGDTFRGLANAPFEVSEDPDLVLDAPGVILWAHHNSRSFYDEVLSRQHAAPLTGRYEDPYLNRTFGAAVSGKGMVKDDARTLVSAAPAKAFSVEVAVLTEVAPVEQWQADVLALLGSKADYKAHVGWWRAFWNRSWVFITGDPEAENLTRSWLLQRFMMACQGRGAWPVKFNGGSLTFDYGRYDADHRRWGPGFWHQNQRLMYWPLLASGDDDLLRPWFDYYMGLLDFQREVTALQFGHGGAYFPETMNPFGLYIQDDWGWDNPGKASDTRWIRYHWSGGLEMLSMMIDAYQYTQDEAFAQEYVIPFAAQVLRFFAEHWPRINHTINFIPANSIEQFWDCLNPTDYIAGIRYDIAELRKIPGVPAELLSEWDALEAAVPEIPVRDGRILPAWEYGVGRNAENPELYAIFPFRLYGKGNELAIKTYQTRVFKDSPACWSQDNIQAALLGLPADAARFCVKKAHTLEPSGVSFPAFWRAGGDWIPDLDNGGSLAMGLQYMLLSPDGEVKPACPENWKVDFKLRARGGKIIRYKD